jgi:hypothetical protein
MAGALGCCPGDNKAPHFVNARCPFRLGSRLVHATSRRRFFPGTGPLAIAILGVGVVPPTPPPASAAAAASCRLMQYRFEPDCLHRASSGSTSGTCAFDVDRPDFGPQIAVWVESADGTTFVDTLMVTNGVALYGIGNRPGRWDLRSGPRFPYGRRPMALPVWAHRRGSLYDAVVMNDGKDDWMTYHELVSSPESYFCRPMMQWEIVDAVTCASGTFRDAKGLFDRTQPPSYYPPRGDLIDWSRVCIPSIGTGGGCDNGDSPQFGLINDLDTIAAATPAYDRPFAGVWSVPAGLTEGDYALMVEVGKEFDASPAFAHPSYINPDEAIDFDAYGQSGNIGQPSVVYRVPFHFAAAAPIAAAAATAPVGYGDWTGDSGDLHPIDAQIAASAGSGQGRLRASDGPGGPGTVHVVEIPCAPLDCAVAAPPEAPRIDEPSGPAGGTSATFTFRQSSDGGAPVIAYELRYAPAPDPDHGADESLFSQWRPAPPPASDAPGTITSASIDGLLPETAYSVGLRARGACGWSAPSFLRIVTGKRRYTTLSGCVIATAAYGSDMDPDVALMRRERDRAAEGSDLVRLSALLYARAAPPLAALVGRSDTLRAAVRTLLRPAMAGNRAIAQALGPVEGPSVSPNTRGQRDSNSRPSVP